MSFANFFEGEHLYGNYLVKRAQAGVVLGWVTFWDGLAQGVTNDIKAKDQPKVWKSGSHFQVEYGHGDDEDIMP